MIQFYSPDIETSGILPESESLHCSRVLRMKKGEEINVVDGKGNRFVCEITEAHPSHTTVKIINKISLPKERDYFLTLAVAPTKNADRMEWMIEKAIEVGVDEVVLLKCERSERKVMRLERLQKVMISAMKQSLGATLPLITEITKYKDFLVNTDPDSQKFFGYCSDTYPKKEFVKELKKGGKVVVMIGPEGDFTPEEVSFAVEKGFLPVSFGNKRLRTETAGVFAVCSVNVINQLS